MARLANVYKNTALMFLNVVAFLLLGNLAALLLLEAKDGIKEATGRHHPLYQRYAGTLDQVYEGTTPEEITKILLESWGREMVFEPVTGKKEASFSGKYLNIHEAGFRHSSQQAEWPPVDSNFNIFLYGGSTTFGYGVDDARTISSYLQPMLKDMFGRPVAIYNFGRGLFHSSLEFLLFEKQLMDGLRPDAVIFVDGLNDFISDVDYATQGDDLQRFYDSSATSKLAFIAQRSALARLADWAGAKIGGGTRSDPIANNASGGRAPLANREARLFRYFRNLDFARYFARYHKVGAAFIVQPVPSYAYDGTGWPMHAVDDGHVDVGATYQLLKNRLDREGVPPDVIWCADVQKDLAEPLYVDAVHYGPKLSRLVARCIADGVLKRAALLGDVSD